MKENINQLAQKYLTEEKEVVFKEEMEKHLASSNESQLEDMLGSQLSFGTAGLRGLIGPGFNRMNPYIVRRVTQGISNYLIQRYKNNINVAICYDSRHYSLEFAILACQVLNANQIHVYFFQDLRPTPFLAYATRYFKTNLSIMITASHNPKEYNGYKVYDHTGAQIISPMDQHISEAIQAVETIYSIDSVEALDKKLLTYVGSSFSQIYMKNVLTPIIFRSSLIQKSAHSLSLTYSSLYGTGSTVVPDYVRYLGYTLHMVPEQTTPNPDFPDTPYPNPEVDSCFDSAMTVARSKNSDIILLTDPDADRVAVAILHKGKYIILNGNQVGLLLLDYLFHTKKELNLITKKAYFINSLVTTLAQKKYCQFFHIDHYETLTGFKWIANAILDKSSQYYPNDLLLGTEESIGYLLNSQVVEKDGVSATIGILEMALYYRNIHKSLYDRLGEIYNVIGHFQDLTLNFEFPNQLDIISKIMDKVRHIFYKTDLSNSPLGKIREIWDLASSEIIRYSDKKTFPLDFPSSNLVQVYFNPELRISFRPSGTEPKLKIYISLVTDDFANSQDSRLQKCVDFINDLVKI